MKKISQTHNLSVYQNHRQEPYFTFLKNGQKTIEGRVKRGEYANLKPGDHIVVYSPTEADSVEVVVRDIREYVSIQNMLEAESLSKILPDVKNIQDALSVYSRFYSPEDEAKFGVIAIEVGIITDDK